ncbi:MAG TPA: hypothetical protein VH394_17905 [Thermoanaerobaculia bacterium]|jgi:hypothetical protein|nr:hypothetical protein [Thermoanaerobaculia bacterium]
MKRLLSLLAFLSLASSPNVLLASPHSVTLRVLDQGNPQAGVEVAIVRPDPERTTGKTLSLTTDSRGIVQFTLDENVFWVTVPSLNSKVVGREFKVPHGASSPVRWDIRPREWKQEVRP